MEGDPSDENVSYMDEYPELKKRVWLRRLNVQRQMGEVATTQIFYLPVQEEEPDDAS